jgi:DNA (cytosine-5)-methyltransferase 1
MTYVSPELAGPGTLDDVSTSPPTILPIQGPAAPAAAQEFSFVDLFAGIGGIRGGLERAGGHCLFSVEKDPHARLTYEANWGALDADDVREVLPGDLPAHDVLAAGFPCQPFSLAGVSKKRSLGRAHGFDDPTSGNLFFEIVRLIGGPSRADDGWLEDEAESPDGAQVDLGFMTPSPARNAAPPVVLLENVRHLEAHDSRRTFRVIRRRLLRSGYWVSHRVINGSHWVPQNRRRLIIVGLRRDLFGAPFVFPSDPDGAGPVLGSNVLEEPSPALDRYRLTEGVWRALLRHRQRHEAKGAGFGYGIAEPGGVTRTLSARYYKDGAEILIRLPDGDPPRRLTPRECARLMGFTRDNLGFEFVIPPDVSDVQAYRQFGNSVIVPQFSWLATEVLRQTGSTLAALRARPLVA